MPNESRGMRDRFKQLRLKEMIKKILKDPLVHFLILGGLLFLLYGFLNRNDEDLEDYKILLTPSDINRIEAAYAKSWNALPDSATLQKLIEDEIRAEIFYREALRMNLDHNDEIIRRRLKQKYEFLVKDLINYEEPTEAALLDFHQKNAENYQSLKKLSFSQIYFSPDKRKNPKGDAMNILQQIENEEFSAEFKNLGDDFHLQNFYAERDFDAIWQLFGKEFAEAVFQISESGWTQPIQSGYGLHLIYISKIQEAEISPFEIVRNEVKEDWKQQNLQEYNRRLFENLKAKYEVEINF